MGLPPSPWPRAAPPVARSVPLWAAGPGSPWPPASPLSLSSGVGQCWGQAGDTGLAGSCRPAADARAPREQCAGVRGQQGHRAAAVPETSEGPPGWGDCRVLSCRAGSGPAGAWRLREHVVWVDKSGAGRGPRWVRAQARPPGPWGSWHFQDSPRGSRDRPGLSGIENPNARGRGTEGPKCLNAVTAFPSVIAPW